MTGYYDLSTLALEWAPMQIDSFNVTDDAGHTFKVFAITIQTRDQVFLMRFLTAETEVKVGNISIDSNTMKIDFEIRWFTPLHVQAPWTTGPSNATLYPNAEVGLAVFVEAVYTSVSFNKTGYNSSNNGQSSVSLAAGGVTGEFSWVTKAATTIQGEFAVAAVHVNIAGAGSQITENMIAEAELLLFSFNGSRPSLVVWDPTLGGKPTPNATATTGMPPMDMTTAMPPMDMTTGMNMMMTTGAEAVAGSNTIAPLCFLIVALFALFF